MSSPRRKSERGGSPPSSSPAPAPAPDPSSSPAPGAEELPEAEILDRRRRELRDNPDELSGAKSAAQRQQGVRDRKKEQEREAERIEKTRKALVPLFQTLGDIVQLAALHVDDPEFGKKRAEDMAEAWAPLLAEKYGSADWLKTFQWAAAATTTVQSGKSWYGEVKTAHERRKPAPTSPAPLRAVPPDPPKGEGQS